MRPLNIEISGFGTYCNKTQIDFTKLGNEGLYLITGDTGSGKTTIFDAITYALYGEPSGSNRDSKMLRSSFATLDIPTYVELEFLFHGKVYKVKRNPEYYRANKRGEGTTKESADAELNLPDGKIISGVKDVNNKIEEILGIKKAQFCQIAMIAQGDFQKILFETSDKRQDFFRTLFRTENYQKLQEELKNQVGKLRKTVEGTEMLLNHELASITCDEDSQYYNMLEKAKNEDFAWEEKIKIINNIIDADVNKHNELESERNKNQQVLDKIKLKISDIEKLKNDKIEAANLKEQLEKNEKLLESLQETVTIKKMALDENGEKENKKALIGNDLPKYDSLDEKSMKLKNLKIKNITLEEQVSKSEKLIEDNISKIENCEKQLLDLKDVDVNYQKDLSLRDKFQEKIAAINEIEKKYSELNKLKNRLEEGQKEYKKASEKAVAATEKYNLMNKAYLDGQAGILAAGLVENQPCPVCGSTSHPNPCKMSVEVPKEDDLELAKSESDRLNKIAEEKSKSAAEIGASEKAKEEELLSGVGKIIGAGNTADGGREKIIIEKESITKELNEIENRIKIESEKIVQKKNIENALPEMKSSVEKLKSESIENNNLIIQSRTESESLEKQIKELKGTLAYESKNEAENEFRRLEQQIDYIKKSYDTALNQFTDANNKINEMKGNYSAITKRIENAKIENEDEIIGEFNKLSNEEAYLNEKSQALIKRLGMNQQALENINKNVNVLIKNEKQFNMVQSLSATANGTLSGGHEKIQLETYVQMAFFDKILHHANTRLLIMSDGQYELVRRKDSGEHRSQTGLDLNVIDHYTGCQRSVKSLSGGECFQASLSLALGLSDEVTSSAGGIKIDTMFVDEGFGSLDPDSIQKAYNALISVSQVNKLVGIISHVDYLKEKIDKQIIVTKTRDQGSSVTIKA